MEESFDLERYLSNGIANLIKQALKATLSDPRESMFLAKYAICSTAAAQLRRTARENGENIPPFLIASITSRCNLHCSGCYARANQSCLDAAAVSQLGDGEWKSIFEQARDLGVSFILLAGGEPLLRRGVLRATGDISQIIFPVFTNGTLLDAEYWQLFDDRRNLIPIISLEGRQKTTDERRGVGVYDKISESMAQLRQRRLTFGVSITVTTQNLAEVTGDAFISGLKDSGTEIVFFVEFVPVSRETAALAPGEAERASMKARLARLREAYPQLIFISFPGDEKASGGCLAAGRGFFHINAQGGAEPCPFSAYSDINVRDTSLREALNCRLFRQLRESGALLEDHAGGCVLFEKKDLVEGLLAKENRR